MNQMQTILTRRLSSYFGSRMEDLFGIDSSDSVMELVNNRVKEVLEKMPLNNYKVVTWKANRLHMNNKGRSPVVRLIGIDPSGEEQAHSVQFKQSRRVTRVRAKKQMRDCVFTTLNVVPIQPMTHITLDYKVVLHEETQRH